MKTLGLSLLTLGLLVAFVPSTGAQESGQTTFNLKAVSEGTNYYFQSEDGKKNPELVVPANTEITVTITNVGDGVHNICFAANDKCSDYVQANGDTATLTFNSGSAGGQYFCLPHKSTGMAGQVRIAGQQTTNGGDDGEKKSPGIAVLGVSAALVGAALLLRRK